ncbi:MAG: class I SAM-dependent methyltransferase [Pseudomonadales bacterium]|nr:methyltransferase domain-containing protein [Oleiphilus messinensis]MCG8609090.1 class I SAM-dependent methyltransferase [Pseudomonadales bacterium]
MRLMKNRTTEDYVYFLKQFEDWFQNPLGRALLEDQRKCVDHATSRLFGFHQLEVGISHRLPLAMNSSLGHKMISVPAWCQDMPENCLVSQPHELAIESDSLDLLVFHHTLDFAAAPHQTLREASRVLRSGGHMLILGFNPISTWGARKLMLRQRVSPWAARFIACKRIEDWLSLLNFRINSVDYHFFRLPVLSGGKEAQIRFFEYLGRRFHLPTGAYYLISAQKQVAATIPLRPNWAKAKVIGMPVANGLSKTSLFNKERDDT